MINDQDIEYDNNKLTCLNGNTVKRNPTTDNELSNKKHYVLDKNTILRFNQALQNFLKFSVGNDVYSLMKNDGK